MQLIGHDSEYSLYFEDPEYMRLAVLGSLMAVDLPVLLTQMSN